MECVLLVSMHTPTLTCIAYRSLMPVGAVMCAVCMRAEQFRLFRWPIKDYWTRRRQHRQLSLSLSLSFISTLQARHIGNGICTIITAEKCSTRVCIETETKTRVYTVHYYGRDGPSQELLSMHCSERFDCDYCLRPLLAKYTQHSSIPIYIDIHNLIYFYW